MEWIGLSFIYGIALAMDCLALSITDGLCFQNVSKRKYFFIAGVFALGQFLFPLLGHFIGLIGQNYIQEFDKYDHWIAFALLVFIGGKMLYEGIKGMAKLNAQQKQNRRNASHAVFKHIGENYLSVLPIVLVVTVLYFVKIDPSFSLQVYLAFLMSAFVIGLGLSLFTAGADLSMTRIGTIVGETLFKKRKIWLIILMKYYVIQKDPYTPDDWNNVADNVPFGSELVLGERNKDSYLVYRNPNVGDATTSLIGHDAFVFERRFGEIA